MSASIVGALIGFVLGFAGFVVLRMAASRIETNKSVANGQQIAKLLRGVALADWLLLIVMGFVLGPMVIDGSN